MSNIVKASAPKCSVCGRLLWKRWWHGRLNEYGKPLGYNPGTVRDGKPVCWNSKACIKRVEASRGQ